jgi:leader peptidase (prepilin peptidase)/N-methyltransferase
MLDAAVALHLQWPWFWPLWGGVLGGVLGSFLSCAAYRLPRRISLRQPPSHCPHCQTVLGVPDLVPILSWLWLRGHCRHCRAPIPLRSLGLEVACVLGGALLIWLLLP